MRFVPPSVERKSSKPTRKALLLDESRSSKHRIYSGRMFLCTKLKVWTELTDLASSLAIRNLQFREMCSLQLSSSCRSDCRTSILWGTRKTRLKAAICRTGGMHTACDAFAVGARPWSEHRYSISAGSADDAVDNILFLVV
jgi:hypothetical protein